MLTGLIHLLITLAVLGVIWYIVRLLVGMLHQSVLTTIVDILFALVAMLILLRALLPLIGVTI